ncbi:hypothetical protein FZC33_11265 [Labrys sp. KNU-23]|uniref:hypothetical protein n=1 Tax=Labrys sp. KNU-23 TaxID=2789216 RepID=UPI0011EC1D74|nr:hypothetical protein [Labrys sp. KNU-23]QEN86870.1 hypothetical protein FZC33_11265 [Labrys sp. KNU-23]
MLRVLMSTNPARFRVSKPGFDAGTGATDDMLIDTDNVTAKVIMAGRLQLSGTIVVPFGVTLEAVPAVDMQSSDGAGYSLVPFRKWGYAQALVTCKPSTTNLTFKNTGTTVWLTYVVVAVNMPS